MTRYYLLVAVTCAAFLFAPASVFANGLDYPPGVPEGSAPLGTDPATGREMWMVPDNSDPNHVAALNESIKSNELRLYQCERELGDILKEVAKAGAMGDYDAGPPAPKAGGKGGSKGGGHDRRADPDDPYYGGTIINPQQNTGPILVGGNLIAALEKVKKRKQREIDDCIEKRWFASWLTLDPENRPSYAEFRGE